ncbi:MAG: ABC transporter permease, partial [Treponema sp.]|nr:ABC transporter permease [Treponema sp.]
MIKIFFSQAWLCAKVKQAGVSPTEFLAYRVGVSITTLSLYVLIARFTTGSVDLTSWVIGNAFALCVFECVFNIGGTFNEERFNGRLRSIIVSPTNKMAVIMYNGASSIVVAAITIAAAFIVGGLIFGISFSGLNPGMFLAAIFTATFACVGMGLMFAALALITDSIHLLLNAVALLIMIFSGANFPVSQLPVFAQWIARAFPLFRSVKAANMSIDGAFSKEFGQLLAGELLLGLA